MLDLFTGKPIDVPGVQFDPNTFFKNIQAVDKPVSPLLFGSMMELGFGRSENPWAELLYNRVLVLM